MRTRILSIALAALLAVLTAASTASAQTTRCSGHQFLLIDKSAFPGIAKLRALNLPRLTSGYAPRCLVAEAIAGDIQFYFRQHSRFPHTVKPRGARWEGGPWTMTYVVRHLNEQQGVQYDYAVGRHGRQTVTMNLTS